MGYVIAMAGKGGTGKTTIAALLTRLIKEKGLGSVLAIDADPNSNLSESLGLELKETIGDILDNISLQPDQIPAGMPKDRYIEYRVQAAVAEGDGFDVLTLGRPEGPGCYCYANNVLRNVMAKLIEGYNYIIIDNEAGLEHLSRRTTRKADTLVVVSDASKVGLKAAKRINDLSHELKITIKKRLLIINRNNEIINVKDSGLECAGNIPVDDNIVKAGLNGNSMMSLSNESISIKALGNIGDKIWH
ncbi:MAG: AAA family ATPase [Candidatus Omnitrophota bacterium]